MSSSRLADAASAANRFGLGARPGTLAGLHDPRGALANELRAPSANAVQFAGLTRSADYLVAEFDFRRDRKQRKREVEEAKNGAAGIAGTDAQKLAAGGFRR